jgi:uncharacterized protein YndB with AHSA1/START domain
MTLSDPLHFERRIAAPPAEAFRAFTHPTALRDWLANDAHGRPGHNGYLFLYWNDGYSAICPISQFEPPNRLEFGWRSPLDAGPTQVAVTFTAQEGGVLVTVEQSGFGEGKAWAETRAALEQAWPGSLENLEAFLLNGVDLRLARRPRLGIWMDELTPATAARLGIPAGTGILLMGTASGSGAAAAGLQKDDVLVSLNGVTLVSTASFEQALHGLKAGDEPPVEYYRAGEKHTTPLRLGSFPILPLPASPAELAATVRTTNARLHAEISALSAGLSETQLTQRPQKDEWSVKELVGHFILTEREYQSWAANMLRDNLATDDLQMRPNVDERIAALVQRLQTMPALLAELALAQEETAALLERLPESFTTWRKHLYRRLAQWSLEVTPGHLDEEHAAQLKATVEAIQRP